MKQIKSELREMGVATANHPNDEDSVVLDEQYMPSHQDIAEQQNLFTIKRRYLWSVEEQLAQFGPLHAPSHLTIEKGDLEISLQRIKTILTRWLEVSLCFELQDNQITLLQKSLAAGSSKAQFNTPYDAPMLPLVIKALEAAQLSAQIRPVPLFSDTERAGLANLGLWDGTAVPTGIESYIGRTLYDALVGRGAGVLTDTINLSSVTEQPLTFQFHFPTGAIDLAALPWELLWDEQGLILLRQSQLVSFVRYMETGRPVSPSVRPTAPLRVLLLVPHVGIEDNLLAEVHSMREAVLSNLDRWEQIAVEELSPVTPAALVERLVADPPIDIIHFCCRGRYIEGQVALCLDAPNGGEAWMSGEELSKHLPSGARYECYDSYKRPDIR